MPCNGDRRMRSGFIVQALVCCWALWANACGAMQLHSQHAIVVKDGTREVLYGKDQDAIVPIASLTKLMTAMVVLDSKPDMAERISIHADDVDTLKHSRSYVPVGTTLPRKEILRLALMSSDNRAAAALARTYPGGQAGFVRAVAEKIKALKMAHTVIKEPTGLSPDNTSTASDMASMAIAASQYRDIVEITTDRSESITMNGRARVVNNTNKLVGARGWDVLLSKTGFTNEAGRCLIMRIEQAGVRATVVLLNANASSSRTFDALSVRRLLSGAKTTERAERVAQRGRRR